MAAPRTQKTNTPSYFQTEDEKRLAESRLTIGGRPVQMVRPMLPSSFDATEAAKWGKNEFGQSNIPIEQYFENSRRMRTVENVPTAAPEKKLSNAEILAKYGGTASSSITVPTPKWQQDIVEKYPSIGKTDTKENKAFLDIFKDVSSSGQPFNAMKLADDVMAGTGGNTYWPPTAPTPQDIAEMEKAGTADISPRFSPIEMRGSTLNAWQSGSLESPIARKDPYATMLNDRPGGGRTYESPFLKPRPMGSGTLSQRPTSTASGASERVAARRAIRMNPKSTEVAQRFARGIGGARNNDSWAP